MADQFLAEIRIFPFNFAPKGWAFCDGQLLAISQNTALFSLLGTYYGGDGKSTFALPNLQGSAPINQGQGPGLSDYFLGQPGGAQSVTLLLSETPMHPHSINAQSVDPGDNRVPSPVLGLGNTAIYSNSTPTGQMDWTATSLYGNSQAHNNMQPYLTLHFCIALQGVYPSRS